jgi:hypothetical protein
MSKAKSLVNTLANDIKYIYEWVCQNGGLTRPETFENINNEKARKAIATILINTKKYTEEENGLNFYLVKLREIKGSEVPFIQWIPKEMDKSRTKAQAAKKIFVGHRFTEPITRNFRHNLGVLLPYYGFSPRYYDTNFSKGQIFETITKYIRKDSFSIFDTKDTANKPNVYIEIGAAHTLNKPYFIFQYTGKDAEGFPSDFHGLYTLRYKTYKELFRDFNLRLPYFIKEYKLSQHHQAKKK